MRERGDSKFIMGWEGNDFDYFSLGIVLVAFCNCFRKIKDASNLKKIPRARIFVKAGESARDTPMKVRTWSVPIIALRYRA